MTTIRVRRSLQTIRRDALGKMSHVDRIEWDEEIDDAVLRMASDYAQRNKGAGHGGLDLWVHAINGKGKLVSIEKGTERE
jgi:hypothetical protein